MPFSLREKVARSAGCGVFAVNADQIRLPKQPFVGAPGRSFSIAHRPGSRRGAAPTHWQRRRL